MKYFWILLLCLFCTIGCQSHKFQRGDKVKLRNYDQVVIVKTTLGFKTYRVYWLNEFNMYFEMAINEDDLENNKEE